MKHTAAIALIALAASSALAWQDDYPVIRMGVLSGENEADRLARYEPFAAYMSDKLGVEVEIFTAGSYDGVVQALAGDQIEFARFGSSSYAAAYTAMDGNIVPLLTTITKSGSTGYISAVLVRCDSGYESLDDLEGRVHAFADPDSTSGYAVPYFNMVKQGYDPSEYFEATPFSGSHESGVLGVVNGTYDSASTWGDTATDGNWTRMELKGMIEPGEVCPIWVSPEITNGPLAARSNLPEEMMEAFVEAQLSFPTDEPEAYATMTESSADDPDPDAGYVRVDHDRYQWIVDMREWLREQRRGG